MRGDTRIACSGRWRIPLGSCDWLRPARGYQIYRFTPYYWFHRWQMYGLLPTFICQDCPWPWMTNVYYRPKVSSGILPFESSRETNRIEQSTTRPKECPKEEEEEEGRASVASFPSSFLSISTTSSFASYHFLSLNPHRPSSPSRSPSSSSAWITFDGSKRHVLKRRERVGKKYNTGDDP